MTVYYETLILANPEITSEETSTLESSFQKVVAQQGGAIKTFDRWGKYRLSFPIEKHEYGVYFLGRFEADREKAFVLLSELNQLCGVKLESFIMRHMHTHLQKDQFEGYIRPESLEEAPKDQEVEHLLRDNNAHFLRSEGGRGSRGLDRTDDARDVDYEGNDGESEE